MKEGIVYLLASWSRTLYIGVTSDLAKRLYQHKAGDFPGFTKDYRVDRLVYYETFPEIQDAIAREKQLKGWTRRRKIELIERENPEWNDLSSGW